MTTKVRFVLAAGFIAVAAAAAVTVLKAQDGPGPWPGPGRHFGGPPLGGPMGPGGPMGMLGPLGRGLRALGLSDAQRDQVRTILQSHKDEFAPIGERMRAAHQGMRALIEADPADADAIRAKSQELAAVEADAAILGAKVRGEVFAVLTPEQQQKAKDLRATMEQRMQQRMQMGPGRMGPRPPGVR